LILVAKIAEKDQSRVERVRLQRFSELWRQWISLSKQGKHAINQLVGFRLTSGEIGNDMSMLIKKVETEW